MARVSGPSPDQLDQVADQYEALVGRHLSRVLELTLTGMGDRLDTDDLRLVAGLWADRVDTVLTPTLGLVLHAGSAGMRVQLRQRLGLTAATWPTLPVTAGSLADTYLDTARNRLVGVGDHLWNEARSQLLEGMRAGDDGPALAARVRQATGLALPRARTIARTEATAAINYGTWAEMVATGLPGEKEWVAVVDSHTRDDHLHADGQTVGVRDKFDIGGWPADRPHDPMLPAGQSVNCRCTLVFHLDLADTLLEPSVRDSAQAGVDSQILDLLFNAEAARQGISRAELDALLDLGPWLVQAEAQAQATQVAAADTYHLPGKHNQKDHGRRKKASPGPAGGNRGRGRPPTTPSASGGSGGGGEAGGRTFDDPAAAKQFLDDHYGQWKKKGLNDAEYAGLAFYQSPGFALMNGQLRGLPKGQIKADMTFNDQDLKRARKASGDLTKGIGKAPPLPEAVQVHRGFDADQFGDSLRPGARVTDQGFTSTSLTAAGVAPVGRAGRPARMRIELPKGTRAGAGSARELILPPGSSFEILGTSQEGGSLVVDARLVGAG